MNHIFVRGEYQFEVKQMSAFQEMAAKVAKPDFFHSDYFKKVIGSFSFYVIWVANFHQYL